MNLSDFADVHTHRLDAGPSAIICLPLRSPLPEGEGYYSVGIHPWDAASATEADMQWVRSLAADPRVVAIGETGLDALRGGDLQRQEEIFLQHARLSELLGKPLILHAVRTLPRLMQLRRQLQPTQRWVVHGFRGKPELACQLVRAGFDISLGEKFNPEVPAVVPADRLHRETD